MAGKVRSVRRYLSRAGTESSSKPPPSPHSCPSATSSDLKPRATATSTAPTKTRNRRSRSLGTCSERAYASSRCGGTFTELGDVNPTRLPGSAVAILQPNDVFDLGRRDLKD